MTQLLRLPLSLFTGDGSTEDAANNDFLQFRFVSGAGAIQSITINLEGGSDGSANFDPSASSGSNDYGPTLTNLTGLVAGNISGIPTNTEPSSMTINFAAGTFVATDGFDLNIDISGLGNEDDAGEFGDVGVTATITFEDGRTQTVTFSNTDGDTSVASFSVPPSSGSDLLLGGDGDDILIGGLGTDILSGGNGADTFRFGETGAGNVDQIVDFSFMENDVIDLDGLAWVGVRIRAMTSTPSCGWLTQPAMARQRRCRSI